MFKSRKTPTDEAIDTIVESVHRTYVEMLETEQARTQKVLDAWKESTEEWKAIWEGASQTIFDFQTEILLLQTETQTLRRQNEALRQENEALSLPKG